MVEVLPTQAPIPQCQPCLSMFLHMWWELGREINPASHHGLGGGRYLSARRRQLLKLFAQWDAAGKVGQWTNQQRMESSYYHKSASRTSQPWLSKIHEHLSGSHLHLGLLNCNWSHDIVNHVQTYVRYIWPHTQHDAHSLFTFNRY